MRYGALKPDSLAGRRGFSRGFARQIGAQAGQFPEGPTSAGVTTTSPNILSRAHLRIAIARMLIWSIQEAVRLRRPAAAITGARNQIMINIKVNGTLHRLDVEDETPLLWVLREEIGLSGTKYGCGIASCGACTVHVDGRAVRSCSVPVGAVAGAEITTIEGLSADSRHPVQQAWLTEQVPQCGYCQSGQIMASPAISRTIPIRATPTSTQISPTFAAAAPTSGFVARSIAPPP